MKPSLWSKYLYVYKTQIIKCLTYRFDVYGNILMQSIIMITSAFFWKALYLGNDTVGGVNIDDMLTYIVVSSMMSVLLIPNVERRIENSVIKGTVATDLMKPINIYGVYLAEDLGSITALVVQNMIPILAIGCLLIRVPRIASFERIPLFVLSLVMSFFINWLVAALFGMWSYTAVNVDALIQVKKHLLRLLSGSIIPMWFFPDWFRVILEALPFVYIYQLPLDIYIGRSADAQIYKMMLIQLVWLIVLFVTFYILQRTATKKVMVQGG